MYKRQAWPGAEINNFMRGQHIYDRLCGGRGMRRYRAHTFNQKKNQDGVYTFSRFFMGLYFLRSRSSVSYTHLDVYKRQSVHSLITTGDLFGVEMLYDIIPNQLIPYDYQAFEDNKCKFYAVATNCRTGEPEYFHIKNMRRDINAVRASSSLPLLARRVIINNEEYLDGGISDSIPRCV